MITNVSLKISFFIVNYILLIAHYHWSLFEALSPFNCWGNTTQCYIMSKKKYWIVAERAQNIMNPEFMHIFIDSMNDNMVLNLLWKIISKANLISNTKRNFHGFPLHWVFIYCEKNYWKSILRFLCSAK